jgi:hypothetical protein
MAGARRMLVGQRRLCGLVGRGSTAVFDRDGGRGELKAVGGQRQLPWRFSGSGVKWNKEEKRAKHKKNKNSGSARIRKCHENLDCQTMVLTPVRISKKGIMTKFVHTFYSYNGPICYAKFQAIFPCHYIF